MRRAATLLLLAATAAGACNRQAPAPPASVLETGVAATLTAAPPLPPTRTAPPTATHEPSTTPTLTLTPITEGGGTAGPTATSTLPPLPTDDPRYPFGINLASPSYRDGFDARYTWGEPVDQNVANLWQDGRLRASDLLADAFVWWSTTLAEAGAGNFYAEIEAEIGACAGQDAAGFASRIGGGNLNNGYMLEVSCDGQYRLRKLTAGAVEVLRPWTASDAILKGPNAVNRIGLLAVGDQLTPFANGVALGAAVQDSSFSFGTFGLYAMARQTPGLVVTFDNLALWHLVP